MAPIYLDNNATTAVDPRVLEAMLPYFTEFYGNAASTGHAFGRRAQAAVRRSRETIALLIGASDPREIVFTSGATESDNLAIKGAACGLRDRGEHIVTVATEHKAVLDSCQALEEEGFRVDYLPVGADGILDPHTLKAALTPSTTLVSVMLANNEIGVIQDISAAGQLCREAGALFHTDATQGIGKIPFHAEEMNVDLASFTAHKIYGPKGAGALYVRRGGAAEALRPQIAGGGHEQGLRSGTLNVTGIVGLAKALELCVAEMEDERLRLTAMRDRLRRRIEASVPGVTLNGHPTNRLPGHLNLSVGGLDSQSLLMELPDVALSTTSACSSGSSKPSHVLAAMGLTSAAASGAIRIGVGRFNTLEEIDTAADIIIAAVKRVLGGPSPA